jgi:DNA helicase-2/ATP-dependent DNA helicase PcrA
MRRPTVDNEFIDDVKREVCGAADALRKNALAPKPSKTTCGACDYRNLCSSATL